MSKAVYLSQPVREQRIPTFTIFLNCQRQDSELGLRRHAESKAMKEIDTYQVGPLGSNEESQLGIRLSAILHGQRNVTATNALPEFNPTDRKWVPDRILLPSFVRKTKCGCHRTNCGC